MILIIIIQTIEEMEESSSLFVVHSDVDFTRDRVFTLGETMRAILGMRGNTLDKKLEDYLLYKGHISKYRSKRFVRSVEQSMTEISMLQKIYWQRD